MPSGKLRVQVRSGEYETMREANDRIREIAASISSRTDVYGVEVLDLEQERYEDGESH